jgi:phosphatidate cytidylyltransferase
LIFFIGLPLVLVIVIFLPYKNHLVVNLLVVVLSAVGAIEATVMIGKKKLAVSAPYAALLGAVCPAVATLYVSLDVTPIVIPCVLIVALTFVLVKNVFAKGEGLNEAANSIVGGFAVLIYPGLFLSWVVLINGLEYADILIVVYLLIVIVNDSLAWAFGMLFGRGNRGIIAASPNKSAAGFAGGLSASIVVGIAAAACFPSVFESVFLPPLFCGFALGLTSGIAAVLGDLCESVLKRSCDVKDSGFIIPGRGGVLDSIDSLSLAAPIFYMVYRTLFS